VKPTGDASQRDDVAEGRDLSASDRDVAAERRDELADQRGEWARQRDRAIRDRLWAEELRVDAMAHRERRRRRTLDAVLEQALFDQEVAVTAAELARQDPP
jgi:hypothetical protein